VQAKETILRVTRDAERTTDRRKSMHKAGAGKARCSDGCTAAPSTTSEFIIHSHNTRWRGDSRWWGDHDIAILRNRRNL
jgi:hypothetical protein